MTHQAEVLVMPNVGLTAADRCDRCGAQAYYEVEVGYKNEGDTTTKTKLLFCAHHAKEHHDKIVSDEAVTRVIDHRAVVEAAEQPVAP